MIHTIGIDIGSGAIKSVLFRHDGDGRPEWLAKRSERIRSRDPMTLARQGYEAVLEDAGLTPATSTTSRPPARGRTSSSRPATSTR